MLVRQLRCDVQTMPAHEPMGHLESRAKSPLAKGARQKQSEAQGKRSRGHTKNQRYHVAIISPGADRE